MHIALLAQKGKKELLLQFCAAHFGALARHTISSSSVAGQMLQKSIGLEATLVNACAQGGAQQMGAKVACGEIDMLFFFVDPNQVENMQEVAELTRLCDKHNIPYATNLATAEVLIRTV